MPGSIVRVVLVLFILGWGMLLAQAPLSEEHTPLWTVGLGAVLLALGAAASPCLSETRGGRALQRLGRLDLFSRERWPPLLLLWLLAHLPLLLGSSYGADPDAWRIASSADKLWTDHSYGVSRFPGYPVVEIGLAPFLALGGAVAGKVVVCLLSFAGLWSFDRLARRLGAPAPALLVLTLALSPQLVIASTSTIDYAVALAGLLGSLHALVDRRPARSGVLLGLAFGSRVTSAAFGLPMLLWSLAVGRSRRESTTFALSAPIAGLLAFSPVLLVYGTHFLDVPSPGLDGAKAVNFALRASGTLPLLALGLALGDALRGLVPLTGPIEGGVTTSRALILGAFAISVGIFVSVPLQAGYLLPAVAIGILLVGLCARPAAVLALLLANLLALGTESGPDTVLAELQIRATQVDRVAPLEDLALPARSIVVTGGAQFAIMEGLASGLERMNGQPWGHALRDPDADLTFVPRLNEAGMNRAIREERPVYLWSEKLDAWTLETYGYSPLARGAQTFRHGARADKGQASRHWKTKADMKHLVREQARGVQLETGDEEAVQACQHPPLPAAEARHLEGEISLTEAPKRSTTLQLFVVWRAEDDQTLQVQQLSRLRKAGATEALDVSLSPPEGASTAQLCSRIRGEGASGVLADLSFGS